MNSILRKLSTPIPFLVRWYLSKKRSYEYHGLFIDILPGVFHPGLFFSTKMMLQFVGTQSIGKAAVLEIGAGTGIISLLAARMGANVTATDISSVAIENVHLNAKRNGLHLAVVRSDLFENLPVTQFQWIFVNPPYFAKQPRREEEFAWYCGEHHEYFIKFFKSLSSFITAQTQTIMVLSDVCDLSAIFRIGNQHHFEFVKVTEKKTWTGERNYIFRIKQME